MSDRLKLIIATILDIPPADVGDDASPETLASWDSVKQMDLMLAVEDDFGVRFSDDEIATLTTYVAIRDALLTRGETLT